MSGLRRDAEAHRRLEPRGVQDDLQPVDDPVAAPAVDQVAGAPGHPEPLHRVVEDHRHVLVQLLEADLVGRPEERGRALVVHPFGVQLVLRLGRQEQLRDADAAEFERPGVPAGDRDVRPDQPGHQFLGLRDDLAPALAGGRELLQFVVPPVVRPHGDADLVDLGHLEQLLGPGERLVGHVVVPERDQGAERAGLLGRPDRPLAAEQAADQGELPAEQQLRPAVGRERLPARGEERVGHDRGRVVHPAGRVEHEHRDAGLGDPVDVLRGHVRAGQDDRRRPDPPGLADGRFDVTGAAHHRLGGGPLVVPAVDDLGQGERVEVAEEVRPPAAALERGGQGQALVERLPAVLGRAVATKQDRAALHFHASVLHVPGCSGRAAVRTHRAKTPRDNVPGLAPLQRARSPVPVIRVRPAWCERGAR